MSLRTLHRYIVFAACFLLFVPVKAESWKTHFAYNNVTQIAMTPDKVFAISDGSLFSVDKKTEQLQVYNRQSGLHASGITCIYYDDTSKQLIICYATGKIDLLSERGVQYLGELYDKDMTQRKTINNITISGRTAYLSTAYGVQTLDLRTNRLVDSYWLHPNGQETDVQDVVIHGDSIYAFTVDSMFSTSLHANIVDYTYWHREIRTGRISPDANKGVHYRDATDHWYAGQADGIRRVTATNTINYKPQGPLSNMPYRMTAAQGNLWVTPGGRWAAQYNNPGIVMRYDGHTWRNITTKEITSKLPKNQPALDFMNVAVDPKDKTHYFVTSYGTGLYEFRADTLVNHFIADGTNALRPAANNPSRYTRLDGAIFDAQGNLWIMNGGEVDHQLACYDASGQWHAISITIDGSIPPIQTQANMTIDHRNPNYKWLAAARWGTALYLVDDQGVPMDDSKHHAIARSEWIDQEGHEFKPTYIYQMLQDSRGRIWLATEQGVAYIDDIDYFTSDAIVRPVVADNNGENPMRTSVVNAICETPEGNLWIGTSALGVYVLDSTATQIIAQYTTENSAMPANGILSLACDAQNGIMYIGTADGLVEYNPNGSGEGLKEEPFEELADEENEGAMQRWKLHFSYSGAQQIVATPSTIYAVANNSLFSVNRADETIGYWNKSTGLNGTTVTHIAYDTQSGKLLIVYEDGRIDLLDDTGDVTQMPDISMKAGSLSTAINCVSIGSRYLYLGISFGIIAINPKKGEIADTYYIGEGAAALEIQQIVENGDSLYAFSYDRLYKASLRDNLVDYSFWHSEVLPCEIVQQAVVFNNRIYTLQHDSLYRREGTQWQLVVPNPLEWIHVSGNQLLTYQRGNGLLRLTDEEQLTGLTGAYKATDAVYSNGQYWLAEEGKGIVRLSSIGDEIFRPEGPSNNFGYRLHIAHNQVYVAPGGRWASQFGRESSLSIYDGQQWIGIPWSDTYSRLHRDIRDAVSYAVNPNDPSHFYVATYGTGVFEYKDYQAIRCFDPSNSTLSVVVPGAGAKYFTRTDGALMDEEGNLWVLNATEVGKPLHILTPSGQWIGLNIYSGGKNISFETPGEILVDRRNKDYKWMIDQRTEPGVIFHYDGGTPTRESDDYAIKRNSFTDQNGNTIALEYVRCIAQDLTNRLWIGTQQGILLIPAKVDFFTSDACQRIIIPRNDGTGLGDYLLGDEQINCMAVDGGNRMWIGTANSGLYLIEDDTITVAHFTENNSLLPSNTIQSIAIIPTTGEVFVGTDNGIASYRSDASEPQEDMNNVYAYPNPVQPNYTGVISITGLMDNTVVNIIDSGGNLVCKTRSHGGTAVWDGKDAYGQRAAPGVYTALCNAAGGHKAVKILIAR